MKKYLFIIIAALAMVGCENYVKIDKANTPIAGRSFKRDIYKGEYDVYNFRNDGQCDVDYYFDYGNRQNGGIYDYRYWMEGDSIFISVDKEPNYKHIRGLYKVTFIILENDTLYEYTK